MFWHFKQHLLLQLLLPKNILLLHGEKEDIRSTFFCCNNFLLFNCQRVSLHALSPFSILKLAARVLQQDIFMALPDRTFYNQRASKLPDQLILRSSKTSIHIFWSSKTINLYSAGSFTGCHSCGINVVPLLSLVWMHVKIWTLVCSAGWIILHEKKHCIHYCEWGNECVSTKWFCEPYCQSWLVDQG